MPVLEFITGEYWAWVKLKGLHVKHIASCPCHLKHAMEIKEAPICSAGWSSFIKGKWSMEWLCCHCLTCSMKRPAPWKTNKHIPFKNLTRGNTSVVFMITFFQRCGGHRVHLVSPHILSETVKSYLFLSLTLFCNKPSFKKHMNKYKGYSLSMGT